MAKRFIWVVMLLTAIVCNQAYAQESVKPIEEWENPVVGYKNARQIQLTRLTKYNDRTEADIRIEMQAGYWYQVNPKTVLVADGKEYALTAATGVELGKRMTMPESGKVDFVLNFKPVPATAKLIHLKEPEGWELLNIRNADYVPEEIENTYWRNEATGDWLIGFTSQCVIYDCKFWDITSQTKKKDTYRLTATHNGTTLHIKVGKMKKGIRTIAINGEKAVNCNPITTATLPDYPTKDLRTGFKDNSFRMGDSVTFIGWLKDMPEKEWKKGHEFKITHYNIIKDEQEDAYTKMDSLGRFVIKMPLMNTMQVFLDWGRTTLTTVIEPGETYLFLSDYSMGTKLFMGADARVQNELIALPAKGIYDRLENRNNGAKEAMNFMELLIREREKNMNLLHERIGQHPNLSQRYIDYYTGNLLIGQGCSMMQARFAMKNRELPQAYMDYVQQEIWEKKIKPYSLYRDFSIFMRDYLAQLNKFKSESAADQVMRLKQEGFLELTEEDTKLLEEYGVALKKVAKKIEGTQNEEEKKKIADSFNTSDLVKRINVLFERIQEPMTQASVLSDSHRGLVVIDSVGCDRTLRDLHLARELYNTIDNNRKPLSPIVIEWMEKEMELPMAKAAVNGLQAKYLAIQNRDISNSASLKKYDKEMEEVIDGEQLLHELIEPYKGHLILLDIWGTWCGPCKAALAKSEEEFKRLAPYDMVFLYLANRSSDESWQNVIKEYNVLGANVVHYNLPAEQQSAIENFVKVKGYPTYRLIDENGNLLDVNADPRDLEGLARLIESMKGKK